MNSLIELTIDKFGSKSMDILVNNAGVAFNKKLIDIHLKKNGIKR